MRGLLFGDGQGQPVRLLSAGNELGRADYRAAASHGRRGQVTSSSRVFHRRCGVRKKKAPGGGRGSLGGCALGTAIGITRRPSMRRELAPQLRGP